MSRRGRGEAGTLILAVPVAIAITVFVTSPAWLPAIVLDVKDAAFTWWKDKPKPRASLGPVEDPFIGPTLPTDAEAKDCVLRVATGAELVWTARGWRSPTRHPEPPRTGDHAVDSGRVTAWADGLRGYVAQYHDEFVNCSEVPKPRETRPPEVVDYSGTYSLEAQGGDCPAPVSARVTRSPPNYSIELSLARGSPLGVNGLVESDGHFSLRGALRNVDFFGAPANIDLELSGQFVGSGDDMLVRGGVLRATVQALEGSGTCTSSFSGIRQR